MEPATNREKLQKMEKTLNYPYSKLVMAQIYSGLVLLHNIINKTPIV